MSVGAVSSLSSLAAAASSASSGSNTSQSSTLSMDFTTYLQILTTQLQNQDPTNATDPNQFTQELVQMEQVQAQITTNTDLEGLTKATSANSLSTGMLYIGNYVRASTSSGEFALQGSAAEVGYTLASASSNTFVTIQNSSGATVATLAGGTASGDNYVTWNGKDANGNTLADGTYTFAVTAVDNNGNTIGVTNPTALYKITSVQSNSDGTLELNANSLGMSSADVTGVFTTSTLPTATTGTALS